MGIDARIKGTDSISFPGKLYKLGPFLRQAEQTMPQVWRRVQGGMEEGTRRYGGR